MEAAMVTEKKAEEYWMMVNFGAGTEARIESAMELGWWLRWKQRCGIERKNK